MKRRDFLKKGTLATGLASGAGLLAPLLESETEPRPATEAAQTPLLSLEGTRSGGYLARVRGDEFLPKQPAVASWTASGVKITPMTVAERVRRGVVPRRGFSSIRPGGEALLSGNGPTSIEMSSTPYSEQVVFRNESVFVPHKHFEAPDIAAIFPQVRQMVLNGEYHEAAKIAYDEWHKTQLPPGGGFLGGPSFAMHLEFPQTSWVNNFVRTVDFESTELTVRWTDERGDWVRRIFASRPDNVVVQWLTAPRGQSVNARITLERPAGGFFGAFGGGGLGAPLTKVAPGPPGFSPQRGGSRLGEFQQDYDEQRLIFKGMLAPEVNRSGYAGVTRVIREGGAARMEGKALVVENASSLMLLTRIEAFSDYSGDKVEALQQAVEAIAPDYEALLDRARKVQSEMLNRVTVDFGGASKHALSSEELLSDQRLSSGYSGAFLETLFEMCRYWFILTSGKYCSMQAETNANINLQIAPGVLGDHREGMDAYFNWMESLVPDFRTNAKNIFGMRGTHYALTPTKESGVDSHFDYAASTGELWPHPYWLSAGGWCVRPFWDHYLVTGDLEFLRNRVVPAYKDLALFYEDFLTVTDKNGNYIFAPSFSPENNPLNLNPGCMAVINAGMDISVCREVLGNLVDACEELGIEGESVSKWKAMIAKLPPHLAEPDGTMKEWAWPSLMERYDHRHISHLYGAWPGDEIDPDRTPKLAEAALIADRHRVPERLAAHGRCHRALVGARLKDSYLVDTELRQLIEEGNVGETLRCSHDPYSYTMPDAQGGIPTIIMEMLAYSRPGVVEVLPALPPSLAKGSIKGMLLRTFARLNTLSWDMDARTVDLAITSVKKQEIVLIARHGIEAISASPGVLDERPRPGEAACTLRLPEGKLVTIHMKLMRRNPLDWATSVA